MTVNNIKKYSGSPTDYKLFTCQKADDTGWRVGIDNTGVVGEIKRL
jgi:hypothetical protein